MLEIRTEELFKEHEERWDHHRPFRSQDQPGLALRTYRALTWLQYAREDPHDRFAPFIYYWIAFNALYVVEQAAPDAGERHAQREYVARLLGNESARESIHQVLRGLEKQINVLTSELEHQVGADTRRALTFTGNTRVVLQRVVDRLYDTRNWLFHGGVALRSHIMGQRVMAGTDIMTRLVPAFVESMLTECWRRDHWENLPRSPDEYDDDTPFQDRPDMREKPRSRTKDRPRD